MKLLLHACCAPCSTACIGGLRDDGIVPRLFWFNPNIHPFTEYSARRESLAAFALEEKLELDTQGSYGLKEFIRALDSDFSGGRCAICYRMRLEKTAFFARDNGFDAFSTTLLTSPHQKHDLIRQIGEECALKAGVEFFYRDFRPLFRDGQRKARANGCYMQKYCGCIFSEEERYAENAAISDSSPISNSSRPAGLTNS